MNIYLIGFRCTGKTSVGIALSKILGWPVKDSDAEVVNSHGRTIADLVSRNGWEAFRKLEKEAIQKIGRLDNQVVSTGGGVVIDDENIHYMKESGKIIWLKAEAATILNRMEGDSSTGELRPPLTDKDLAHEINDTLCQRNPLYEKAGDFSIITDHLKVNEVCAEILKLLEIN